MNSIEGKWRIAFIPTFKNDEFVFLTREEALKEKPRDKDLKALLNMIIVISGNKLSQQVILTGKMKQEAIEEGMKNIEGDIFECDSEDIIEKDGKYYYAMGHDEIEDQDHLEELKLEDGYLIYSIFKLERISD